MKAAYNFALEWPQVFSQTWFLPIFYLYGCMHNIKYPDNKKIAFLVHQGCIFFNLPIIFFGCGCFFVVTRDHIKYYHGYESPHQILSCLPLLYFIIAVFVDSFVMSMIVVDDKSIFFKI